MEAAPCFGTTPCHTQCQRCSSIGDARRLYRFRSGTTEPANASDGSRALCCSSFTGLTHSCASMQALRELAATAPLDQLMSQAAALRDSGHSVITFSPKV